MSSVESPAVAELSIYAMPVIGPDGAIDSVGAAALRQSLQAGSARGVSDLLRSMDVGGMTRALTGAGFSIPKTVTSPTWEAVLQQARPELQEALGLKTDGFGLNSMRRQLSVPLSPVSAQLKEPLNAPVPSPQKSREDASAVIQRVMRSSSVHVSMAGPAPVTSRNAMLFVAGQGLEKGIQGFAFDGQPGKYQVDASMHEVAELHGAAAVAVAQESVRTGLAEWAAGNKVTNLSPLVPDGIQQRLTGSLSVVSAQAIAASVASGALDRRASETGAMIFASMLSAQGLDLNAKTVVELAADEGLELCDVNRERGRYFGVVVAEDHRALLLKINRKDGLELPRADLKKGEDTPKIGDALALAFNAGALTVNFAKRVERDAVGR